MNKNLLFTVVASLSLLGCKSTEAEVSNAVVFSGNFIQAYVVPHEIFLVAPSNTSCITIEFDGEWITNTLISDKEKYESISNKYGDKAYNNYLAPLTNVALPEPITSINVVCDRNMNDEYPAGTSLNNIVKLYAVSPMRFIQNNYVQEESVAAPENLDKLLPSKYGYYSVSKLLNEVEEADLTLLYNKCVLYFTQEIPQGEYELTITIDYQGNKLSEKVRYIVK